MSAHGTASRHEITERRKHDHLLRLVGPLIADLLMEDNVTDVILNPDGRLSVTRLGAYPEFVGSMRPREAESLIAAVASTMDTVATRENPIVEGHLLTDGSRFEGVLPPVVTAPIFAIRRHASAVFTFAEYVERGQMTERQCARLEAAVLKRENVLITGSTGSGKTTLLNSVLEAVARLTPKDRVIGVEDTIELRCACEDQTFMVATASVSMQRLLTRVAMRLNPTRLVVGEVRGKECLDLLMAGNTGHSILASVHANVAKPQAALDRLENLVLLGTQAPMGKLIAEAIDLIVCVMKGPKGHRQVTEMVSVGDFVEGKYQLTPET